MKQIELFIHTDAAAKDARTHTFNEEITVEELILFVSPTGHEELVLFVEDETEPKARHHRLHDAGLRHHHHVHIHHKHHPRPPHNVHRKVVVTINGAKHETHAGSNEVEHLRSIGKVPADEILAEFKDGKFVDLANNARVEICGGELFASHVKSAGSS